MSHANLGCTSSAPTAQQLFNESLAYQAGVIWAQLGNKKLPSYHVIGGQKIKITRSRTLLAKAFVDGWKSAK